MPNPTFQSFVGIAKETVKGTAVAATAFIPVKSMTPVDHQTYLPDTGMRGSQVSNYGQIASVTWAEYDFGGDVLPDTIGYPVAGILGDVTVVGATAPFTHAAAVKNSGDGQPLSFTISDYNNITTRQLTACQFSDLSFTFVAEGLLEYTAKAMGNITATTTLPVRSYTSVPPIPSWRGVMTLGGSADLTVLDGTCDIKRTVTAIHTVDNTAAAYRFWAGPVTVTGKLAVVAETEAQLLNYLNNTQPSIDINFQQGAGAAANGLLLHMSKAAYVTGQINRGKDYIGFDITYEAVANTTDIGTSGGYSPIKATVTSALPAGTYA